VRWHRLPALRVRHAPSSATSPWLSAPQTHLVVLDGFGQRLHVDRLVQLVLVQQLDQEVQRALVDAHLGVQHPHLLVHLHTALVQGPGEGTQTQSAWLGRARPVSDRWNPPGPPAGPQEHPAASGRLTKVKTSAENHSMKSEPGSCGKGSPRTENHPGR